VRAGHRGLAHIRTTPTGRSTGHASTPRHGGRPAHQRARPCAPGGPGASGGARALAVDDVVTRTGMSRRWLYRAAVRASAVASRSRPPGERAGASARSRRCASYAAALGAPARACGAATATPRARL